MMITLHRYSSILNTPNLQRYTDTRSPMCSWAVIIRLSRIGKKHILDPYSNFLASRWVDKSMSIYFVQHILSLFVLIMHVFSMICRYRHDDELIAIFHVCHCIFSSYGIIYCAFSYICEISLWIPGWLILCSQYGIISIWCIYFHSIKRNTLINFVQSSIVL